MYVCTYVAQIMSVGKHCLCLKHMYMKAHQQPNIIEDFNIHRSFVSKNSDLTS